MQRIPSPGDILCRFKPVFSSTRPGQSLFVVREHSYKGFVDRDCASKYEPCRLAFKRSVLNLPLLQPRIEDVIQCVADKRESEFASNGMKNFVKRVEELVGFEITDNMLLKAINAKNRLDSALGKMRRFIETSEPLVISPTNDSIFSCLQSLPLSEENINEAVDAINTLHQELKARNDRGLGAVNKGAPRVLAMLPMHHADPRLEYLAGQIGINPETGELVKGTEAQTRQVMENIKAVLEEAGASMDDIMRCDILLVDLGEFKLVNEIYAGYFQAPYPARVTVASASLPKGARVEIAAIATI